MKKSFEEAKKASSELYISITSQLTCDKPNGFLTRFLFFNGVESISIVFCRPTVVVLPREGGMAISFTTLNVCWLNRNWAVVGLLLLPVAPLWRPKCCSRRSWQTSFCGKMNSVPSLRRSAQSASKERPGENIAVGSGWDNLVMCGSLVIHPTAWRSDS